MEDSTSDPDPVLPSTSPRNDPDGWVSLDTEFSRVLVANAKLLDMPPLQILLEPHALPRPPKVGFNVVAELLFSDDFVTLVNERGCQTDSALSFAATLHVESYARAWFAKAILQVLVAPWDILRKMYEIGESRLLCKSSYEWRSGDFYSVYAA